VLLAATRVDADAFGVFYLRYERLILGYPLRGTGDPEVAADLTAEMFAAALAGRYRPEAPTAVGWLLTSRSERLRALGAADCNPPSQRAGGALAR
jgi:RNA polymerase sigma-70 factor (ECF subfamily)